ncbi:MAG: hypothetical protein CME59_22405 [Halioglobus sp.]|nr:hypothetical protein [Halioglobus sp.]
MRLRGNLFVKVFIAFWLVTCAILGSWMLTADYFDSRPPAGVAGEQPAGPPHRFVLRMMYDLQSLAREDLAPLIAETRQRSGLEVYLLDHAGRDILERPVPDAVGTLAAQLDGRQRRAVRYARDGRLVAYALYRQDTGPLRAVFVHEHRRSPLLRALGASPALRIVLAILVSGLVCFALSRLLTNRLKALQQAARRIADGELDTRLQVRERGGDETDELARDFNTMAAELQARIQSQRRLLSDVSHELRSPLARLRIALALAQQDDAGRAAHLARIEQEAERLEELIGQLLSSQAGQVRLDSHVDLVALLERLCDDAGFEGQARDTQVRFESTLQQAVVRSSGDLLHKSFENLLRNALAHTAQGSTVRVTLAATAGGFSVAVEDHGPGVPEGELDNIFDALYRVDTARTRDSGGYGLGLSIARRAIEQHGGSVRARNTGSGLVVQVELPAGD